VSAASCERRSRSPNNAVSNLPGGDAVAANRVFSCLTAVGLCTQQQLSRRQGARRRRRPAGGSGSGSCPSAHWGGRRLECAPWGGGCGGGKAKDSSRWLPRGRLAELSHAELRTTACGRGRRPRACSARHCTACHCLPTESGLMARTVTQKPEGFPFSWQ
jgi:hypothetical protein